MDREYYQSLSEAYQQVQEQGGPNDPRSRQIKNRNQPEWAKKAGDAINNFFKGNGASGNRKPTVQQQQREKMRQNRRGRSIPNPNPPASTPAAQPAAQPASQPAASSAPAAAPRAAAATPAPKPTPAQRPSGVSGTDSRGNTIRTSDVQRRNAATADRAAKVRAAGGDPTAGGEFKTKVTDTGSDRLNKALSGIGKWNEETVLEYCGKLIEARLADNVDDAYVILTHLDETWVDEALGE